jgi:hypothetical protein
VGVCVARRASLLGNLWDVQAVNRLEGFFHLHCVARIADMLFALIDVGGHPITLLSRHTTGYCAYRFAFAFDNLVLHAASLSCHEIGRFGDLASYNAVAGDPHMLFAGGN